MIEIFILLILFQVKHFLADYPLQTPYMLGKFQSGWKWVEPLSAHSWIHMMGTVIICYIADMLKIWEMNCSILFAVMAFDFIMHFTVDRIKASPNMLAKLWAGQNKIENKYFWWALGFDQMVHHLTHYAIIICLIMSK